METARRSESADTARRESRSTEDAPAGSADTGAERLIEFVEAESGRPVPDAEVWYRTAKEEGFDPSEFEEMLAQADTHALRTDVHGLARIRCEREPLLVLVRSPGRLGGEVVEPSDAASERVRIELYPDWDLVVEVVDAQGRPAGGITVGLEERRGHTWDETDAAGRVTFAHLGSELALAGEVHAEVRVALALPEQLARAIDLRNAPAGPVRFHLPPLASLSVLVLDAERRPVPDGTYLQLGLVGEQEEREPSPFAHADREYVENETQAGRALFPHVPLGGELELVVTEERSDEPEKHYFRGPTIAGEQMEHTVLHRRAWPILMLRALDETGAAIAGAKLVLELYQRAGYDIDGRLHEITTDAEGRFEVDLAARFEAGAQRWLGVTLGGGARGARIDLGREFPPGRTDFGDVILAGLPLLVSGRVVDGGGAALEGVAIEAESPIMNEADGGGGIWYWRKLELSAASAADGSFVLRAIAPAERLRIVAVSADRHSSPIEVAVGSSGVELVLEVPGFIAGAVRCDPGIPVELVAIRLAGASTAEADVDGPGSEIGCPVEADGDFRSPPLLPGVYTLFAGVEDHERLVTVKGIEVRPGERSADRRLAAVDLRGLVYPLCFVLRTEDPGAIQGSLSCRPAGSRGDDEVTVWLRERRVRLLTPHASVDGRLVVRGFRPVTFAGASGELVVDLVPALPVELVLPAAIELPEPPRYLKAVLAPEDDYWLVDFGAPVFAETRKVSSRAPLPGRMRVHWILEQRGATSSSADPLEVEPPQWVEVLDVDQPQRFVLEVTNDALAAALAAAREE